ncbi:MAG: LPS export ABC transporter periplasmic protein LptC [Leptolyngbya sp. SIO4C1]|nr:LPS export ABC transporter periplasmic protein LptC [Leptolyngbya sp. SIO4C1]
MTDSRTNKWYRWTVIAAAVAVLVVGVRTCQASRQTLRTINQAGSEAAPEPGLTLQNVTLEQPDEDGTLLWKVKAKEVVYSANQKIADIKEIEGEFYQDGKAIYKVKGDRGEVAQDAKVMRLEGNVVATGIESQLTLRGEELEWRPEEDLLLVENQISGTHPQLKATAQQARLSNQSQQLDLSGGVTAATTAEPWLGFQSEALTWYIDQARLVTETGLKTEQYRSQTDKTVTARLVGERGNVNLNQKTVLIENAVQLDLPEQPVRATSSIALWQIEDQQIVIDAPVQVQQPQQQVTISANQARMNLAAQVINFVENVRAIAAQNSAELLADRLTWQLESQDVTAQGNVSYRQQNPLTVLSGDRAAGNLERQTVVVTGGDVVTEIVPP